MHDNETIIRLGILTLISSGLILWTITAIEQAFGKPLLPIEPHRPVPWGLLDLFLSGGVFIGIPIVMMIATAIIYDVSFLDVVQPKSSEMMLLSLEVNFAASILSLTIILLGVKLRSRSNWSDLGFQFREPLRDVGIALKAFLLLAPPVFLIQSVLTQLYPSDHPLIKNLKENPSPQFFVIVTLIAVVAAPLIEELMFRVLLQGWLERMALFRDNESGVILGGIDNQTPDEESRQEDLPTEQQPTLQAAIANDNPYAAPQEIKQKPIDPQPNSKNRLIPILKRYTPMFLSATLFAGVHQGYDRIPLFFFALGLGYLYQRTHRILPCILMHMFLNGTSMLLMWLSLEMQ